MVLSDQKSVDVEFCREYTINQELFEYGEKLFKSITEERNIEKNAK